MVIVSEPFIGWIGWLAGCVAIVAFLIAVPVYCHVAGIPLRDLARSFLPSKPIVDAVEPPLPPEYSSLEDLEQVYPGDYYYEIIRVMEKVEAHYDRFALLNREAKRDIPALVCSTGAGEEEADRCITRAQWAHCFTEPSGVFWRAGVVTRNDTGSIVLKDGSWKLLVEWFRPWLTERGMSLEDS